MENMKLAVTQDKREETIDKILKLIETEFRGIEVTGSFTIKILEDAVVGVKDRCLQTPLRIINNH